MAKGKGRGHGSGSFSGYKCVKILFFVFNVIFWLMGCALLGVGIWLHVSKGSYASLTPSADYFSVTAVCIAAGCLMIVISFFGCCGAIMENQCMLIFYFGLVVIIFILEVSLGVLAFVFRDEISDELRDELNKGLQHKYGRPDEDGLTDAWDHVQQELECCGVHNESDWYGTSQWPNDDFTPDSCCEYEVANCGKVPQTAKFEKGCYDEVKDVAREYLYILGVIGITIGLLQILGLVAAMSLFCYLRSDKYEDYYES